MRKLFAVATLGIFLASGISFADNIKQREKRQQKRINRGVQSGELTKKEALKIEKKEAQLPRQIKKDRSDGGGLTVKERAKIHKKQDKLSRRLAKEKHDDQKRDKSVSGWSASHPGERSCHCSKSERSSFPACCRRLKPLSVSSIPGRRGVFGMEGRNARSSLSL